MPRPVSHAASFRIIDEDARCRRAPGVAALSRVVPRVCRERERRSDRAARRAARGGIETWNAAVQLCHPANRVNISARRSAKNARENFDRSEGREGKRGREREKKIEFCSGVFIASPTIAASRGIIGARDRRLECASWVS